jgi:hypothetical protein
LKYSTHGPTLSHYALQPNGCKWCIISPACCDWIPRTGEQFCDRYLWLTLLCLWRFLHGCQQYVMLGVHFKDGSRDITNLSCRGQPRTISIECNVQKVDAIITADWRTTVRETVALFHCLYSLDLALSGT